MKLPTKFLPIAGTLNILLTDDDDEDCRLFKEALEELPITARLTIVNDGDQLMEYLTNKENKLPDVLFLDLNMPRKSGYVSLGLIKRDSDLLHLPVIIFSTVSEEHRVTQVFRDAAHYYIRKPSEFAELKRLIYEALTLISQQNITLPQKDNFIITGVKKAPSDESNTPTKETN